MKLVTLAVLTGTVVLAAGVVALTGRAAGSAAPSPSLYPDLRTAVPRHLQLVNQQQRETLRFSNSIGNTGGGPWALRPEHELGSAPTTTAIQEIRSNGSKYLCGTQPKQVTACYTVLLEHAATTFEYHPTHNHWHTGQVALFQIRKGSPTGPVVGGNSIKVGFCLIDVINQTGNAPSSEKVFWDCETSYQGISAGWMDQYHQSTDGQQLDITGVPNASDYYLVSTSNPDGVFLEQSTTNNTAWVRFSISADSKGNRKLTVLGNSPCETPALCGAYTANRG
jgi:hypothetical protein